MSKTTNPLLQKNNQLLDDLKKTSLFQGLPNDVLDSIASLSEVIHKSPNENIIKEGENNQKLFFLIAGCVGIYVGGQKISQLSRKGDLIGEMSLISDQEASSTVKAETDSTLIGLQAKQLLESQDPKIIPLKSRFYHIFAILLAERLRMTNTQASQYESSNKELKKAQQTLQEMNQTLEMKVHERTLALKRKTDELEQQNTILLSSNKKLEELMSLKIALIQKLENLYKFNIKPLQQKLRDFLAHSSYETQQELQPMLEDIDQILFLMKPLHSLYSQEQALRSKRILYIKPQKKQQIISKMALGGTGIELDFALDDASIERLLKAIKYDVVFVESESITDSVKVLESNPLADIVLISGKNDADFIKELNNYPFIKNIVSRHDEDRIFTTKNFGTTALKLINKDIFGLNKYLSLGADIHKRPITSSADRTLLIEEMELYFHNIGVKKSIIESAKLVAEELLMNAIYDAPQDSEGKAAYNHLPRTTSVILKPHEQGVFNFACDGMLAAISVEDYFGAFTLPVLTKYLETCFDGQAGCLNAEKGGAGRGLHLIITSSDLVVFNVHSEVKTEILAFFNLDRKNQTYANNPLFHFFSQAEATLDTTPESSPATTSKPS